MDAHLFVAFAEFPAIAVPVSIGMTFQTCSAVIAASLLLTACAANATTIAIDRVARFGVLLPVSSSPIGFRYVATETDGFEINQRLIAVIALVADDLFDALAVWPHGRSPITFRSAVMLPSRVERARFSSSTDDLTIDTNVPSTFFSSAHDSERMSTSIVQRPGP